MIAADPAIGAGTVAAWACNGAFRKVDDLNVDQPDSVTCPAEGAIPIRATCVCVVKIVLLFAASCLL